MKKNEYLPTAISFKQTLVPYKPFCFADKSLDLPILEFSKTPSPVIVSAGSDVSFCVRIISKEKNPLVRWEVAGKSIEPSEKFRVRIKPH